MNKRAILSMSSLLLLVMGCAMMSTVPVSLLMKDSPFDSLRLFFCSAAVCVFSAALYFFYRRRKNEPEFRTGAREGFVSVFVSWLGAVLIGAVPFLFLADFTFPDAFFESASGLTTTGASIIGNSTLLSTGKTLEDGLESLPAGLLYWRSLLNWLGGVGIVVFVLLVLPLMNPGQSGQQLYNAEVPGLKTSSDQATPRLSSSVRIILFVYLIMTGLTFLCYWLGGMTVFDAVCHAFSTVSTGGFSTKTASIGYYRSPFIQWSCIVFMFFAACNFTLIVRLFVSRKFQYFKDEEFRFFFWTTVISTLFVTFMIFFYCPVGSIRDTAGGEIPRTAESYLRTAAFQIISIASTTGFSTSDYTLWNIPAVLMLLFFLMFPCGCGGSTSGGMKCVRLYLVFKLVISELRHCLFPRAITDIRLNGERMDTSVISKMMAFLFLYLIIFMLSSGLLTILCEMDMTTAFSASLACLSNIGPGLGKVSPNGNYAWMNGSAKYLLSLVMIAGRLELYTCLVILLPSFWKR